MTTETRRAQTNELLERIDAVVTGHEHQHAMGSSIYLGEPRARSVPAEEVADAITRRGSWDLLRRIYEALL